MHHNATLPGATNTALPITTSCSFNRSLWHATGNAIAREGRAYANVNMSGLTFWTPVSLARQPRRAPATAPAPSEHAPPSLPKPSEPRTPTTQQVINIVRDPRRVRTRTRPRARPKTAAAKKARTLNSQPPNLRTIPNRAGGGGTLSPLARTRS